MEAKQRQRDAVLSVGGEALVMQLSVRDVAALFNVPEATVYRWVAEGDIPAHQVKMQYRFSRAELLEWATHRHIEVSPALVAEPKPAPGSATLGSALEAGGIFYGIEGTDRRSALRAVVSLLRLPADVDRASLLEVLVAREELASTGIGDGIAIPHVRTPIVADVATPTVTLCFLAQPIEFGALDGKPVQCLFTVVSPTVQSHLQLLSKLAFVLRSPDFRATLARRAPAQEILALGLSAEAGLTKGAPSVRSE